MMTLFGIGKRKVTEDKVANIVVNTILNYVDEGFPVIAAIINESPEFNKSPKINEEDSTEFLLILIVANLNFMSIFIDPTSEQNIRGFVVEKFASVLEITPEKLEEVLKEYKKTLSRINHPSKNMLYAMSKGIFYKYNLVDYQESEFFRNKQAPNPIFIKRLDEIMGQFIFNWEEFVTKYKIVN